MGGDSRDALEVLVLAYLSGAFTDYEAFDAIVELLMGVDAEKVNVGNAARYCRFFGLDCLVVNYHRRDFVFYDLVDGTAKILGLEVDERLEEALRGLLERLTFDHEMVARYLCLLEGCDTVYILDDETSMGVVFVHRSGAGIREKMSEIATYALWAMDRTGGFEHMYCWEFVDEKCYEAFKRDFEGSGA